MPQIKKMTVNKLIKLLNDFKKSGQVKGDTVIMTSSDPEGNNYGVLDERPELTFAIENGKIIEKIL